MKHWIEQPLVHPLREKLTIDDWNRIQEVLDGKHDDASIEELEAATDLFFDAMVTERQTHEGLLCIH